MFLERLLTQGGPGPQPPTPVRPGVGPPEKGVYTAYVPVRLSVVAAMARECGALLVHSFVGLSEGNGLVL
jgi:hypothetical protein